MFEILKKMRSEKFWQETMILFSKLNYILSFKRMNSSFMFPWQMFSLLPVSRIHRIIEYPERTHKDNWLPTGQLEELGTFYFCIHPIFWKSKCTQYSRWGCNNADFTLLPAVLDLCSLGYSWPFWPSGHIVDSYWAWHQPEHLFLLGCTPVFCPQCIPSPITPHGGSGTCPC